MIARFLLSQLFKPQIKISEVFFAIRLQLPIMSAQDEAAGKETLVKALIDEIEWLIGSDESTNDTKMPLLTFVLTSLQRAQLKSWADNTLPVSVSIAQLNAHHKHQCAWRFLESGHDEESPISEKVGGVVEGAVEAGHLGNDRSGPQGR